MIGTFLFFHRGCWILIIAKKLSYQTLLSRGLKYYANHRAKLGSSIFEVRKTILRAAMERVYRISSAKHISNFGEVSVVNLSALTCMIHWPHETRSRRFGRISNVNDAFNTICAALKRKICQSVKFSVFVLHKSIIFKTTLRVSLAWPLRIIIYSNR